jgi:transposase
VDEHGSADPDLHIGGALLPRLEEFFNRSAGLERALIPTLGVEMKKRLSKKITPTRPLSSTTKPDAAGIDIGAANIHICVPADRDPEFVRIFETFTPDLYEILSWLKACRIKTVAMEATGVYWIPLYEILDANGIEVFLVNPRDLKRDKKTDILDCQLLQQWHSYGLLKASFRPSDEVCVLRSLIRHRANLIRCRSVHIQHMQKSLHQMNLQLDNVISDITGTTGMQIIRSIVAGNHDANELAKFRHRQCKRTYEDIAKSLQGNYRREHLFTLKQSLASYDFFTSQISDCDDELESIYLQLAATISEKKQLPQGYKKAKGDKNSPKYDLQTYLYQIYGTDLTQISGISSLTAQIVFSEIGTDLRRFSTVKHFTRWLRLSPDNRSSGKKIVSAPSPRHFNNRLTQALRIAAASLSAAKSPLGDLYRKKCAIFGPLKAQAILAHKLARIIYFLLTTKNQFDPVLLLNQTQKDKQRLVKNLISKAQKYGYKLVPVSTGVS